MNTPFIATSGGLGTVETMTMTKRPVDVPAGPPRPTEGNARLTAAAAAVLFCLFAAEGVTLLQVKSLLTPHVFIGMLLVPPTLVKMGTTGWRMVRYYQGDPAYRAKGPPLLMLRLLGPVVVVLTVVVLASGIVLLLVGSAWRDRLLLVHKASFVLWFGAMTVHVLGHLLETARLAPADWVRRTRREVRGAGLRQWILAASLVAGFVLGFLLVPKVGPWLVTGVPGQGGH